MKDHLLNLQQQSPAEREQDGGGIGKAAVTMSSSIDAPRCPHLERWLPRQLDLEALPNGSQTKWKVRNPVHALHLASLLDEQGCFMQRTSSLFGDEQKRTEGLLASTGVTGSYQPIPLSVVDDPGTYCVKKRRIERQDELKPSAGTDRKKSQKTTSAELDGADSKTGAQFQLKDSAASADIGAQKSMQPSDGSTVASSELTASSPATIASTPVPTDRAVVSSSTVLATLPSEGGGNVMLADKELSQDRYLQLRQLENQVMHQRRWFAKREKRKPQKKSKRRTEPTMHTTPDFSRSTLVVDDEEWEHQARLARNKVETWLQHYRHARQSFWETTRGKETFVSCVPCGSKGKNQGSQVPDDGMMQCLECSFVGSAPKSLSKGSKQGIVRHMLTQNHKFAVSCGRRCSVYCFECGDVVYHRVFHQEKERVDLSNAVPEWAWPAHAVQRSFDAWQFRLVADQGIVWRGVMAEYLDVVPPAYAAAARLVLKRFRLLRSLRPSRTKKEEIPQQLRRSSPSTARAPCDAGTELISAPIGLYNLGNTCFMNGIIQCLVNCLPLQKFFLEDIGHDHMACRLLREQKRRTDSQQKGLKAATQSQDVHSAGQAKGNKKRSGCLACALDTLFLEYYGSSRGMNILGALKKKSAGIRGGSLPDCPEESIRGTPLIPSNMLTEAWQSGGMDHLAGYEQRDAHEFLQAFLDTIGKNVSRQSERVNENLVCARSLHKPTQSKQTASTRDVVKELFEGSLRSVSICNQCGCKRALTEPFLNVSLPLSEDTVLRYTSRKMNIQHCLRHFTAPEVLADPIECPSCARKTPTRKQQTFARVPKVLCLHLKRFDAAKNRKITDFVSFPAYGLDMGPLLPHWREVSMTSKAVPEGKKASAEKWIEEEPQQGNPEVLYDLFGTVNHNGTLNQGHYVSNVKVNERWYHCNDAYVVHTKEEEVLKSEGAYILFYMRRN